MLREQNRTWNDVDTLRFLEYLMAAGKACFVEVALLCELWFSWRECERMSAICIHLTFDVSGG